jgi:hypothetical protein
MTGSSKSAADGKAQKAPNKSAKAEKQGGKGRADVGRRDKGPSRQSSAGNATLTKETATAVSSKIDAESKKKWNDSSQASSSSSEQVRKNRNKGPKMNSMKKGI